MTTLLGSAPSPEILSENERDQHVNTVVASGRFQSGQGGPEEARTQKDRRAKRLENSNSEKLLKEAAKSLWTILRRDSL